MLIPTLQMKLVGVIDQVGNYIEKYFSEVSLVFYVVWLGVF